MTPLLRAGALLALLFSTMARAEAPPRVIRVAAIGTYGHRIATSFMGVMQARHELEKEFAREHVTIQWLVTDGAGPVQNEAIANHLVDFANYGALPNIIGRARGLNTRILASYGYSNSYVAARADLPIRGPRDLRGHTIGVDVGHVPHLALTQLLRENGLTPADVRMVAMKTADSMAALAAGRIDATIGTATLYSLVDQGKARIIFSSKGRNTRAANIGAFLVTDDFARQYPQTTKRVVKAYLRAVRWASEPANRDRYLTFLSQVGNIPLPYVRKDWDGETVHDKADPLPDGYYVSRYRDAAAFSLANKLIRRPISVDDWIDARFIRAALGELGLADYWKPRTG